MSWSPLPWSTQGDGFRIDKKTEEVSAEGSNYFKDFKEEVHR